MSEAAWARFGFCVGMPHMVPNQLSEVELLKTVGDQQWKCIATLLETPPGSIVNEFDERLYASFINIEYDLVGRCFMLMAEDTQIELRHAVRMFGGKFVEGLCLFDGTPLPNDLPAVASDFSEAHASSLPWVYMNNAFVTRQASNTKLAVFSPKNVPGSLSSGAGRPRGITEHRAVQDTGAVDWFQAPGSTLDRCPPGDDRGTNYEISPESDLNGAGLLYFARYPAIMNHALRRHLRERAIVPMSSPLLAYLSPEKRRVYYFANAAAEDSICVYTETNLVEPAAELMLPPAFTRALSLQVRQSLYRVSDGTLMAVGVAVSNLVLPSRARGLLAEARRILAAVA